MSKKRSASNDERAADEAAIREPSPRKAEEAERERYLRDYAEEMYHLLSIRREYMGDYPLR